MVRSTRSGFGRAAAFASCLSLPSDVATVPDGYTRDALLLAPDGTTFQGSDAIGGHYLDAQ